ncbi:hypothetical protein GBA52_000471 [Prunus armeniaca]|nr:hypothetical protein GBA52_000471 [Prunus armeniaca]
MGHRHRPLEASLRNPKTAIQPQLDEAPIVFPTVHVMGRTPSRTAVNRKQES